MTACADVMFPATRMGLHCLLDDTFQGPGASNTTKIQREDPPREGRKKENCGGRGQK